MTGCTTLEGPEYAVYDSYEAANRKSYEVTDWVDRQVIAPLARGYQKVSPHILQIAIGNVFDNLRKADSVLNACLQGDFTVGIENTKSFLVNSTLGIGGLINMAPKLGIETRQEDLGQTFAKWGLTRTEFIFIPLLGPSTRRDLLGTLITRATPRFILGDSYRWWFFALDQINSRASLISATEARDSTALDPYAFTREAYYQQRKFALYNGSPPVEDFFIDFEE